MGTAVKHPVHDDWITGSNWNLLHSPAMLDSDDLAMLDEQGWTPRLVTVPCGRSLKANWPGLFTRLYARRCDRCCDLAGMERGIGSPKNMGASWTSQ